MRKDKSSPAVGSSILNLVTTGMYQDPLAIYREYIQNSADAIESWKGEEPGRVEITIDLPGMKVQIRDNGPGLSEDEARAKLLPVARSPKQRTQHRGFRGIGRLSGLAFAETVTFLTRSRKGAPVSRVIWKGSELRKRIFDSEETDIAIRNCVSVGAFSSDDYPDHFFEVDVAGVGRHAAGSILDRNAVRAYIGEVCPVPFSRSFPFAEEIGQIFDKFVAPLTLDIVIEGESCPVRRMYGNAIRYSSSRMGDFSDIEEFRVPSIDGEVTAAVGWIAHSSYLGAIPKAAGIRGVRIREGNIQIGGEAVLDHLFPEARFNRWCVGEIHVLDPRIVPNGRRDYFEPGPHTRNLENHLGAVLHRLATRCRRESTARNRNRSVLSRFRRIGETYDLAMSGYLSAADAEALVKRALMDILVVQRQLDMEGDHMTTKFQESLDLENKLRDFTIMPGHPQLDKMSKSEIAVYRRIFRSLVKIIDSPQAVKEIIETILSDG